MEWLKDEQKYVDNEQDRKKVDELFQRAVQDYLCKYFKSLFYLVLIQTENLKIIFFTNACFDIIFIKLSIYLIIQSEI